MKENVQKRGEAEAVGEVNLIDEVFPPPELFVFFSRKHESSGTLFEKSSRSPMTLLSLLNSDEMSILQHHEKESQ